MAIIVAEEHVIPLSEVPDHAPRKKGKKLHVATVFRWKDGIRGVRLETIRIGGTLHTSVEALQKFFEGLSATDTRQSDPSSIRTPAARLRAVKHADRELERIGI